MTPPTSLSTLGPTACGSHVIIGASDSSLSPRDSPPLPTKGPTKTGHQCGAVLQHRPSPKQVTALYKPCGVHCRCICRSDGRTLASAGGTAGRAPAGPLAAAAPNKLPALLARGRDKAQTSRVTWLRLLSYLVCACVALGCHTAANAARQQLPSRPPAASVDAHGVSSLPQPVKRLLPPWWRVHVLHGHIHSKRADGSATRRPCARRCAGRPPASGPYLAGGQPAVGS